MKLDVIVIPLSDAGCPRAVDGAPQVADEIGELPGPQRQIRSAHLCRRHDLKDGGVTVRPQSTRLLIRRVRLDPAQVSADLRSRRRRTLHPDQRALPLPGLAAADAICAYSFILTNLEVSAPGKAEAVEHWYRHRTAIENIFRDSKHGAALRYLPADIPR